MPKDNKTKHGLWEDGKRIEWFDSIQVTAINNFQLNYTTFFHQDESDTMVDPNSTFNKPKGFENKLVEVKKRIAALQFKIQGSSGHYQR